MNILLGAKVVHATWQAAEQGKTASQCHLQVASEFKIADGSPFLYASMSLGSFQCKVLQLAKMPSGATAVVIPWPSVSSVLSLCAQDVVRRAGVRCGMM